MNSKSQKAIIESNRLFLREMTTDDFDALYKVLADDENMKYYPHTFDDTRVRNWIQRNIERYRILGFGLWAVCLKETGEMIGDCGLTMQLIKGKILPEIGYHIRKDQQQKGYAKEAACAVRDWTFLNTPFQIIYSYMKHTNEASYRTALSYGCKEIDEFEDEVNGLMRVLAITRQEWECLYYKN
ncbi:MAG: GNAT family N-acetyltransferase [Clostridiaceae bacterium]|nr:GNAT family N-acetyltransferase [Clostridiaceae bacterium]